jgi:septum formation protein
MIAPPTGAGNRGGETSPPLLLASSSPRRRELLAELGIPFEVATGIPFRELSERENEVLSPSEFVWHNALGKALAARRRFPGRAILAADTIVSLGAAIFGKPRDRVEAVATLRALSGNTHSVQTAVVAIDGAGRYSGGIERTLVTFRRLTAATIARYLDAVDVSDKAGSYAIQERGEWLVEKIEGSFSNVIGLPLERVARLLSGIYLIAR